MRKNDKKERLISAAKYLIYRQGYHQTTLADISEKSGISLGNLYYYFKTKEDILYAVAQNQADNFSTLIDDLEGRFPPKERLIEFMKILVAARNKIADYGCPIGSLNQEISKTSEAPLDESLNLVKRYVEWASEQFRHIDRPNADQLGRTFIAALQGASLLTNSLHDPDVFVEQTESIKVWVESL